MLYSDQKMPPSLGASLTVNVHRGCWKTMMACLTCPSNQNMRLKADSPNVKKK